MQDDVSLLLAQLYLGVGRTQDARKAADTINVDNPERKEVRSMAAAIISEAWARTGKPKEALALLDTIQLPKKDAAQIATQIKVVRVFAKFAANQRGPARTELQQLADEDVNNLGRFLMPQFRVHPELQKLARSVLEQHPQARANAKAQAKSQKRLDSFALQRFEPTSTQLHAVARRSICVTACLIRISRTLTASDRSR